MGDDDDDIMFVEDRDPLTENETEQFIHVETIEERIQFVAGEIIVEETVDTNDDGVTHSDTSNDLPFKDTTDDDGNLHEQSFENVDVEEHLPASKLNYSVEAINEQSETISVSDSLSCFDSDTDPQEAIEMEEMDEMDEKEEMQLHSENKNKSEHLAESIDDVILMQDSRADAIDDDNSCIPNGNDNNQISNASAAIEDDSQQFEDNLTRSLNENTTDYDDDSCTSQDRRTIRPRGDRKNYSYRRGYVSRRSAAGAKLDNEMEEGNTQSKVGNPSSQNTTIMPESQNPELIANQQNQSDGHLDEYNKESVNDETQVEFMFKQNTSIRTYERRKKRSSVKPILDDHQGGGSTSKDVIDSRMVDRIELTSLELAEAAVNADEINIKLNTEIGSISESDSNSQIEVEMLRKKRSVGRPRKQRANAISDRSESEQENQEQMSQPSLLPPPMDEIKSLVGNMSDIAEQTDLETLITPVKPNDSLPMNDAYVSTNSNVIFEESITESDVKSVTEVQNTQASTSQSGVENIIETSPVNSEPIQDLGFEVMDMNGKNFK